MVILATICTEGIPHHVEAPQVSERYAEYSL